MSTVPPSPSPSAAPQPVPTYLPQFAGTLPTAPPRYDVEPSVNPLALVAFIGSFFVGLVGVICGHIALSQLKKTRETGYGFALAGVIIGYVTTAFGLLTVTLIIVPVIFGIAAAEQSALHSAQAAPVSQADATTVTEASSALTTSIDSIASTMVASPAPARDALNSAEEAFKSTTSTISDGTLRTDVHYLNDDLTFFSSDLANYTYGDSGGTTEHQLWTDISTIKSDLATFKSDCR